MTPAAGRAGPEPRGEVTMTHDRKIFLTRFAKSAG